jgi:hypothetical protein
LIFLYIVMMPKQNLLSALVLALTLLPVAAHAYTDPQEALSGDQFVDGILVPPTPEQARQRAAEQRKKSADLRAAAQAATFGGGAVSSASSSEATHGAAGDGEAVSPDLMNVLTSIEQTLSDIKGDSVQSQTLRRERALARLEAIEAERDTQGDVAYINGGQQMHGGAPLASTGPETWMAGGALALAVAWTLWQSRREAMSR